MPDFDYNRLGYFVGLIGIGAGLAALIANIKAINVDPASNISRKRRVLAIAASIVGLAVCPLTFAIPVDAFTVEGPVVNYGWPFVVATTDRYAGYLGREWYIASLAFWVLAPQIVVYVYHRFLRATP